MKLRIAINGKKIEGPYGGVNQFASNLEDFLCSHGHEVFRTLVPRLNLILIVSSQYHPRTTSFSIDNIRDYHLLNPNTVVVHRINSLDEQRGQDLGINQAILNTNLIADYTIFISSFLRDSYANKGLDLNKPFSVILNGADERLFYPSQNSTWVPEQKLRIVTHHWSSNYLKGFDIYERLDLLLAEDPFCNLFEFTFIGNLPLGIELTHSKIYPPTWGSSLADLLRQNHVYLTAARHEAAGMHQIEGMRCGLPALYLNSGALPEYCQGYGVEFNLINFEEKLLEIKSRYQELYRAVLQCPYSGNLMSTNYENFFQEIMNEKPNRSLHKPQMETKLRIFFIDRPKKKIKKLKSLSQKMIKYLHES